MMGSGTLATGALALPLRSYRLEPHPPEFGLRYGYYFEASGSDVPVTVPLRRPQGSEKMCITLEVP